MWRSIFSKGARRVALLIAEVATIGTVIGLFTYEFCGRACCLCPTFPIQYNDEFRFCPVFPSPVEMSGKEKNCCPTWLFIDSCAQAFSNHKRTTIQITVAWFCDAIAMPVKPVDDLMDLNIE